MSLEENKAIARRWNDELWSKGNVAAVDELMATNFVWHTPFAGVAPNLEGFKQSMPTLASFADMNSIIEVMVAEGDKVAVRWAWNGKHTGEFMGVAPTGKQLTLTGISIIRIAGGEIVEEWDEQDNMGFMEQLGAKLG